MYKFLVPFLVLALSCAPKGVKVAKEEIPEDTLLITEVPTKVETVYITTVETVVETVEVVKEVPRVAPGVVKGAFKVQIGAFENKENADRLYESLKEEYGELIYIENIPPYRKVRVGNYKARSEANGMRDKFREKGYADAWVVPIDRFK